MRKRLQSTIVRLTVSLYTMSFLIDLRRTTKCGDHHLVAKSRAYSWQGKLYEPCLSTMEVCARASSKGRAVSTAFFSGCQRRVDGVMSC